MGLRYVHNGVAVTRRTIGKPPLGRLFEQAAVHYDRMHERGLDKGSRRIHLEALIPLEVMASDTNLANRKGSDTS